MDFSSMPEEKEPLRTRDDLSMNIAPLANLDQDLKEPSKISVNDVNELRDILTELPLKSDHAKVHFGESRSAPSSPTGPKPARQRFSTGHHHPHGRGRLRHRQFSRQLSHTAVVTLGGMRQVSQRTFSAIDPSDENPERGTWSSQFEFFLSCLGYAVGLGNVWRFPYLCHKNGGGAFLIPYFLMLVFCGLPVLVLELSLGQYSSEGPITIWKISPIFKGIGIGMVLISGYLACYYNMVTGWGVYYLFKSLTDTLPWRCCQSHWDPGCVSFASGCGNDNTSITGNESSVVQRMLSNQTVFSADEYFHKEVLVISESINEMGNIQLHLFLSLLVAWVLVFLVLMKGIKSFGKTVYFTSVFPYVILFILLIRAAIEPGALNGVAYYLTPKWDRLKDAKVWGDAVTQIFFSTSVCTGGIITLASYNRFHNNCYRDALIIGIGNSLTSIFSGFVVFSILGFMAEKQNLTIEEIAKSGPGLTFIIYPQAVTLLPISPLWSALFFLMLITLALSSMFPTVENITTSIIDQFPATLRPYKFWVTLCTCAILFLIGVALTTNGGIYVLLLLDKYGVGWALVIVGFFEVVVFAYRYGTIRIKKNVTEMIPSVHLGIVWDILWKFACPILLLFSLIFSLVDYEPLEYREVPYPNWANGFGWFLSFTPFLAIPIYASYYFIHKYAKLRGLTFLQRLRELSGASPTWGPALPQNRGNQLDFDDDDVFSLTTPTT